MTVGPRPLGSSTRVAHAAGSPSCWGAPAVLQLPNPDLYSLAKPQGLKNHKLNLGV